MKRQSFLMPPPFGLDSRPALYFSKLAARFQSKIEVTADTGEYRADGRKFMDLMLLAADKGSLITIEIEGPDEDAALAALRALIESRFESMPSANQDC